MPETDKNKIPRTLGAPDFITEQGQAINADQAYLNAVLAMSAALVDISECLNNIAADLTDLRNLSIKRAVKDEVINPVEAEEMDAEDAEESGD